MSSTTIRGADIVMRTLDRAGLHTLFTLSGNHIMSLFDAAIDTRQRLVHTRHEAAAVHMADAWGRLTGEPGIAMVTGGPGQAKPAAPLWTAKGKNHHWCCCPGIPRPISLAAAVFRSCA